MATRQLSNPKAHVLPPAVHSPLVGSLHFVNLCNQRLGAAHAAWLTHPVTSKIRVQASQFGRYMHCLFHVACTLGDPCSGGPEAPLGLQSTCSSPSSPPPSHPGSKARH